MGLSIPHDVAVVGYDDSEICELMPVKLTSIRYPKYETGLSASEILIKLRTGMTDFPRVTLLNPELIIRQSCGYKEQSE